MGQRPTRRMSRNLPELQSVYPTLHGHVPSVAFTPKPLKIFAFSYKLDRVLRCVPCLFGGLRKKANSPTVPWVLQFRPSNGLRLKGHRSPFEYPDLRSRKPYRDIDIGDLALEFNDFLVMLFVQGLKSGLRSLEACVTLRGHDNLIGEFALEEIC